MVYVKRFFLIVPHNKDAAKLLESGQEDENIMTFIELTEAEFHANYMELFSEFDTAFNIIIGEYEEEYIDAKDADETINIVNNYVPKQDSETFRSGRSKILQALELTKKCSTYLEFAF